MAFWIPEVPESVALGITSLLCSLAFRDTVEMPDTADVTWSEVFMMIGIGYQVSVMFIIWISYGASTFAKTINRFCNCIKPEQVQKQVVRAAKASNTMRKSAKAKRKQRKLDKTNSYIPSNDFVQSEGIPSNDYVSSDDGEFCSDDDLGYIAEEYDEIVVEPEEGIVVVDPEIAESNPSNYGSTPLRQRRTQFSNHTSRSAYNSSLSPENIEHVPAEDSLSFDELNKPEKQKRRSTLGMDDSFKEKFRQTFQHTFELFGFKNGGRLHYDESIMNVDWIGRWFVVPSYILLVLTLLVTGWGFFDEDGS